MRIEEGDALPFFLQNILVALPCKNDFFGLVPTNHNAPFQM
jgi:hypothetical protein